MGRFSGLLVLCGVLALAGCQYEPTGADRQEPQPVGEKLDRSHFSTRGSFEAEVYLPDRQMPSGAGNERPITVTDHRSFTLSLPGALAGRSVYIRAGSFAGEVWLDVPPGGIVGVGP
jgi:hypothetical protein